MLRIAFSLQPHPETPAPISIRRLGATVADQHVDTHCKPTLDARRASTARALSLALQRDAAQAVAPHIGARLAGEITQTPMRQPGLRARRGSEFLTPLCHSGSGCPCRKL